MTLAPNLAILFRAFDSIAPKHFWIIWVSNLLILSARADPGWGGGAPDAPPPLKLEKIWFFGVKLWFFTRNTPTIFAPPSQLEKIRFFVVKSWFFTRNTPKFFACRDFFKCAPPNLKSWIHPWSVPNESYSRNASCALIWISAFYVTSKIPVCHLSACIVHKWFILWCEWI